MADLLVRRSHRLQGLPHDSPLVVEGNEGGTMDQLATVEYYVEGVPVIESGEEISSFQSPFIVQQPSTEDTTFRFRTEGQPGAPNWVFNHLSDDTVET